mmetsp:Transcript_2292/g.2948  ORF Transcript_2292/g.2948 Transcript_2292/m.2948 type:complete len:306 (+) Transcript_2292:1-918(+)
MALEFSTLAQKAKQLIAFLCRLSIADIVEGATMDYEAFAKVATDFGDKIILWATDGAPKNHTAEWPLAQFEHAALIVMAYLGFVLIGSMIFKAEAIPALKLYPVQFIYNVVQIMLCSYMCIEAGLIAYRQGYTILPCNAYNKETPPVGNVLWLFYISKVLDFMDTFFIVIGKKWRQLSFLHVYHHCTIFLFYWLNTNAGYDGDIYLTIVLNGFIHTVMYTYYFLSMHTRDIWWKKYLTMMQMIQFLTMMSQATYLLTSGCKTFPPRITQAYLIYIFSLLVLFAQFFVQSYMGGGKKKNGKKVKPN